MSFDRNNVHIQAFATMHVLEIEFNGHPVFMYETREIAISWVEVFITVGLMKGILTNALSKN